MGRRGYENDDDFILDLLEEKEEEILERICKRVPKEISYDFSMLLAIRNTIEKIYHKK
jgi:hypothetical protein